MAVVQKVMLYGPGTWVVAPRIGGLLGGFHRRVEHILTLRQPRIGRDSGWVYPLLVEAMGEVGIQEVETYISLHQNTVEPFMATRPIMYLCLV